MKKTYYLLLLLIFPQLFLGGCKAYRNVENLKPKEAKVEGFNQASLNKLVEGDNILVIDKTGKAYHINFKQIDGQNLLGLVSKINGKKIQPSEEIDIPISMIDELKVKRFSPGATIALGIALGYLITMTTLAILYPPIYI